MDYGWMDYIKLKKLIKWWSLTVVSVWTMVKLHHLINLLNFTHVVVISCTIEIYSINIFSQKKLTGQLSEKADGMLSIIAVNTVSLSIIFTFLGIFLPFSEAKKNP